MKRSEAGSGGRRGHSNMSHWDKTAWVKSMATVNRRANDKLLARIDPEDCGHGCHCMLHDTQEN